MLYSAFILGFLGSFHCVGMCGPIALSLPLSQKSNAARWLGHFTYQFGKITAYVVLGLIFGFFGKGISLLGVQEWFSILMGASVFLLGLAMLAKQKNLLFYAEQKMSFLKINLNRFFQKHTFRSLFSIGFFNGLLPCGLVYLAIVGAIATGSIWLSMTYMLLFGLGVMPSLVLLSIFGHLATLQWRGVLQKIYPYASIFLGVFLILRGVYFINLNQNNLVKKESISIPMCHGN